MTSRGEVRAVITAAGLGTRMLPASKEIPKEMFPAPFKGEFKPIIQVIFEQLFERGVRDFVIVVGRGKRVIEDHFTPDYDFLQYLERKGRGSSLREFYTKVEESRIAFVNQPEPRGFGDAVLRAKPFISGDFVVVGADTLLDDVPILSPHSFLVTRVEDPRPYGTVILRDGKVVDVEEKPKVPKSNLVVVPYYYFSTRIFDALERVRPDSTGEVQLTEGIRILLREGVEFYVREVNDVYDLGSTSNYASSLQKLLVKWG